MRWLLLTRQNGTVFRRHRHKQISLSAEHKPMVQRWLRNYRKLKDTLERICELNQQLLRPEENA